MVLKKKGVECIVGFELVRENETYFLVSEKSKIQKIIFPPNLLLTIHTIHSIHPF